MKCIECKALKKGAVLFYVFNRRGYKYKKVTFLKYVEVNACSVEVDGRIINADILYLFDSEGEARRCTASWNRAQIRFFINKIQRIFCRMNELGDNVFNEDLLHSITREIIRGFYRIKDKTK